MRALPRSCAAPRPHGRLPAARSPGRNASSPASDRRRRPCASSRAPRRCDRSRSSSSRAGKAARRRAPREPRRAAGNHALRARDPPRRASRPSRTGILRRRPGARPRPRSLGPSRHAPQEASGGVPRRGRINAVRAPRTRVAGVASIHGEPRDDFLGRHLGEFDAVPELAKLPLERVAELRLLVDAELVLAVETDRARAEPFEDDLELVLDAGIGARLGCRWKAASEIGREHGGELLDFPGVEKLQYRHGRMRSVGHETSVARTRESRRDAIIRTPRRSPAAPSRRPSPPGSRAARGARAGRRCPRRGD